MSIKKKICDALTSNMKTKKTKKISFLSKELGLATIASTLNPFKILNFNTDNNMIVNFIL